MKEKDSRTGKTMKLHSTKEMIGINQAWRIETQDEISYFVSPAVFTLLEDESIAEQVMNDIPCKEISFPVREILKTKSELKRSFRFG